GDDGGPTRPARGGHRRRIAGHGGSVRPRRRFLRLAPTNTKVSSTKALPAAHPWDMERATVIVVERLRRPHGGSACAETIQPDRPWQWTCHTSARAPRRRCG